MRVCVLCDEEGRENEERKYERKRGREYICKSKTLELATGVEVNSRLHHIVEITRKDIYIALEDTGGDRVHTETFTSNHLSIFLYLLPPSRHFHPLALCLRDIRRIVFTFYPTAMIEGNPAAPPARRSLQGASMALFYLSRPVGE